MSLHTSPLDQPGTGDAGGMNVYVLELSRRLARAGVEVDIFTRARDRQAPTVVTVEPGVVVRHVYSDGQVVTKNELPGHLCALTRDILAVEAALPSHYTYDLVHSHYWLSGNPGLVAADRWNVPLVHTMHTMALVKNSQLAEGDVPEPAIRVEGERQVVGAATRLIANTASEAEELVRYYDATPGNVGVVHPGTDLQTFRPASAPERRRLRAARGLPAEALVVLFVGRIQPLKGPDVLLRAVQSLKTSHSDVGDRVVAVVCGGPSGAGDERIDELRAMSATLGLSNSVRFEPPASRQVLAEWYQCADVVAVPSYSESFGLVALEAQACGVPVVAARVGGLQTSVRDGESGVLVDSHEPEAWSAALSGVIRNENRRRLLGSAARDHATKFSWEATTRATLGQYRQAFVDWPVTIPVEAARAGGRR